MKKLFPLFFLFVFFLAALESAKAQNATVLTEPQSTLPRSEEVKAAERQYFGCARCEFLSKAAGNCTIHQIPLIRVGTYYCPALHGVLSDKAGTCSEHNIALNEMIIRYKIMHMQPQNVPAGGQGK